MSLILNGTGTISGLNAGGLPDASITQSDLATGVAGTGPAFSAYRNAVQNSISGLVWTKVQLNAVSFDTASGFEASTNFRYTPNVPGYYVFMGSIASGGTSAYIGSAVFKNGTQVSQTWSENTQAMSALTSCLVYMNGTTDYVELFGFLSEAGSFVGSATPFFTYFHGYLAKA